MLLIVPAFTGVCLTLATLIALNVGGPLLVNVSGTMKDVVLTYISLVILRGDKDDDKSPTSILLLTGLALSFLGASYQLVCKFRRQKTEEDVKEKDD